MKWFKHYSNASDSNALTTILAEFGFEGYGRYWILLENLARKFNGEDTEFVFSLKDLRDILGFYHTNGLLMYLQCLSNVGVMSFQCEGKVLTISTSILLELQSRDFKKARSARDETAPKIKNKNKIKNKSITGTAKKPSSPGRKIPVSQESWEAYQAAYLDRYGVDPIRNAKVNTNLKQLVERVGKEEAPEVIRFFLSCSDDFLVKKLHPIGILLQDCETYHTRWRTGIQKINSRKHSAFSEKNQETLDWINELEKQENKNQIERLTNGKTELQN